MSKFVIKYMSDGKEYTDEFEDIELAIDRFKKLNEDGKLAAIFNLI